MNIKPDMLIELLEQYTPSGSETLTRDFVIGELRRLNFTVQIDKKGNVYAVRGVADKYPLLNAHMDIVDMDWGFGYSRAVSKGKTKADYGWGEYDWRGYSYTGYEPKDAAAAVEESKEIPFHLLYELETILYNYCCDIENVLTSDRHLLNYDEAQRLEVEIGLISSVELDSENYTELFGRLKSVALDLGLLDDADALQDELDAIVEEIELEGAGSGELSRYEVSYDEETGRIEGSGGRVLGGDDKCGIFIALSVLELMQDLPAKVLFTVEEEIGCIGIDEFAASHNDFFDNVGYSLTIDRKGGTDLLSSQCGKRSCTWNFAAKLAYHGITQGIPVTLDNGNVADVITIRDFVPNSVNMSAGYYNAHSEDEYIKFPEVVSIIKWVKAILSDGELLHYKAYRPHSKQVVLPPTRESAARLDEIKAKYTKKSKKKGGK